MANKNLSISVVVPVYNVAKLLSRCIDSIIAQTLRPLEIILVDDGSPDDSGAICDSYADKFDYIRVIHKSNGGLSSARKAGFKEANGELIVFIDSDDYIAPEYLEKLSAPMADPDVQLTICAYSLDNHGKIMPQHLPYTDSIIRHNNIARDYILPFIGRSQKKGEKNLPGFVHIRMYRTTLLSEEDFVSERKYFTEDVLLNVLYGKRVTGAICVVNEPLYYYCINPGSLTLRYRDKAYEMRVGCYHLLSDLIRDLPATADEKERRLEANLISSTVFCIFNIGRLTDFCSFKKALKELISHPEIKKILNSENWPTTATWHKIIRTCYRMKAWMILYLLLKTRRH